MLPDKYEFRCDKEGSFASSASPRPEKLRLKRWSIITIESAADVLMKGDQGLMHASERHGFEGEGFSYLRSPIWWVGVIMRTEPSHRL
ncbi:unnamed protein product [Penicillium manginii]